MKEVLITVSLTGLLTFSVLWRAQDWRQALSIAEQNISKDGLEEVRNLYAADEITIEEVEAESEFWLSVESCDLCDKRQMCSGHFERFYGGY